MFTVALFPLAALLSVCRAAPVRSQADARSSSEVARSGLSASGSSFDGHEFETDSELALRVPILRKPLLTEKQYSAILERTGDLTYTENNRQDYSNFKRLHVLAKEIDLMPPAEQYMCSSVFFAAIHDTFTSHSDNFDRIMGSVDVGSDLLEILANEETSAAQTVIVQRYQNRGKATVARTIEAVERARNAFSNTNGREDIRVAMLAKLYEIDDPKRTILSQVGENLTEAHVNNMEGSEILNRLLRNARAINISLPSTFIPGMISLNDISVVAAVVPVPRASTSLSSSSSNDSDEEESVDLHAPDYTGA
ncbi:hypothetical protein FRB97_007588 [Tulasnella sp. 331]|nr:hypothetical protein FRB97_007588 [Tulasnella sp. 331]